MSRTWIIAAMLLAATQAQAQSVYTLECRVASGPIMFLLDDRTGQALLTTKPVGSLQIPGRFRVTGRVLRFTAPGASAELDNRRATGTITISGRPQLMRCQSADPIPGTR